MIVAATPSLSVPARAADAPADALPGFDALLGALTGIARPPAAVAPKPAPLPAPPEQDEAAAGDPPTPAETGPEAPPAPVVVAIAEPAPEPAAPARPDKPQSTPQPAMEALPPVEMPEAATPVMTREDEPAPPAPRPQPGKAKLAFPDAPTPADTPPVAQAAPVPQPLAPQMEPVHHTPAVAAEDGSVSAAPPPAPQPSAPDAAPAPAAGHEHLPPLLASQTPALSPAAPTAPQTYPAAAPRVAQPVVVAQPGRIGRDLGIEIARHVGAGRDELLVRLDPAELGRVDVRLSFDEGGHLHAALSADSPAALDMLRRDAGDLTRSLADAGIRTDAASFRFESRSGDGGHHPSHQHPQPRAHAGFREAGGDQPLPTRPLRASGRIDLMA